MATGAEHYGEAERLAILADSNEITDTMLTTEQATSLAQVHATLAVDGDEVTEAEPDGGAS